MELNHSFTVPVAVDAAWATFMDLERVGGCFPGATVTEASDNGFSGTVKVKLGPIALQYAGSGTFVERDEGAHRAVIEAKGKDKRGNGTAGATVTIQLTADGDGTRADVSTDLSITGKPAQFGRGVMQDVSDKLLQQFVSCVEGQFDRSPATEAAVDGTDPDRAEGAGGAEGAAASMAADPAAAAVSGPGVSVPGAGSGSTPSASPRTTTPRPSSPPVSRPVATSSGEAIDLGATLLPVLVRQYLPYLVSAAVGIVLGVFIARRRSG